MKSKEQQINQLIALLNKYDDNIHNFKLGVCINREIKFFFEFNNFSMSGYLTIDVAVESAHEYLKSVCQQHLKFEQMRDEYNKVIHSS